jgi:hypothetical protein
MGIFNFSGIALLVLFNLISWLLVEDYTPISRLISWGAIDVSILLAYFFIPLLQRGKSSYASACNLIGNVYVFLTMLFGIIFMIWPPESYKWPSIIEVVLCVVNLVIAYAFIKADNNAK